MGGVISGYCATGSVNTATSPSSVIRIDGTEARIGRSMKKRENIAAGLLVRFAACRPRRTCPPVPARGDAAQPPCSPCDAALPPRPGRARCNPLTMTRSSGPKPDSITRSPSSRRPTLTRRYSTTLSLFTVSRNFSLWSVPIARSLTSRA